MFRVVSSQFWDRASDALLIVLALNLTGIVVIEALHLASVL